jgi:hypothetical protein
MQVNRKISSNVRFKKKFMAHANKKAEDTPKELKGYLQKKSPAFFRGWQVFLSYLTLPLK